MTREEAKKIKEFIEAMITENAPVRTAQVYLSELKPGEKFEFNGWTLTVLDKDERGVLCLTDQIVENRAFHKEDCESCNNWATSSLREYLNGEFYEGLENESAVLEFERDLTSDDGLKDYGTCIDKVSLLTCDEYRKFRRFIDNKEDWWWTITPYSTPYSGYSYSARLVDTDGSLNYNTAFNGNYGVSPAYCLDSSLIVKRA